MSEIKKRNIGIDAFRTIALFFVVILHCLPYGADNFEAYDLVNLSTRFAVPFFFIVSGYFIAQSKRSVFVGIKSLLFRLCPIFIGWLVLYYMLFYTWWFMSGETPQPLSLKLIVYIFLTGGDALHLWFLPSLGVCSALVLILKRFGCIPMLSLGLLLYSVALIFFPYGELLDMPEHPFMRAVRFGIYFGFIFVVIGYCLSKYKINLSSKSALALAAFGFLLSVVEQKYIAFYTSSKTFDYDVLIGTLFYGTGVFLFAKNIKGTRITRSFAKLSEVSLGAYCIHFSFALVLVKFFDKENYEIIPYIILVTILSFFISYIGSKIPYVRRIFV